MREAANISYKRRIASALSLAALVAVLLAVTPSCSRNEDMEFPQEAIDGDYVHVELEDTRAGGDYKSTTYRIIVYGQPEQAKSDKLLYVTDGSYCNPKGGTHNWLTPCSVKDSLTESGNHRYVFEREDVQAGVVFLHNVVWYYDPDQRRNWYYSYNQNAYKIAVASAAIPVMTYNDTVTDGGKERIEPHCALTIRRDIGDGDRVAVSGLTDITVSTSYAGGSYVYTVPSTVLYERRARLAVQITCDTLIEAGAMITAVRMRDVLEEAYYRPENGTYVKEKGQIYTQEPILYKEINRHIMPLQDTVMAYSGDDVYLIAKDYSETKTEPDGSKVSACIYPVLEVCLGDAWVKVPLNVNIEPQHNYFLKVVVNKVHVKIEMAVLEWDVMPDLNGTIKNLELPSYLLGEIKIGEWDDKAGGPSVIDQVITPGHIYGNGVTDMDLWHTGGITDADINDQETPGGVTGKGGDNKEELWEGVDPVEGKI